MASDGYPVQIPAASPLQGSQALSSVGSDRGSKSQTADVKATATAAAFAAAGLAAPVSPASSTAASSTAPSLTAAASAGVFKAKATAAVPTAPVPIPSHTPATALKAPAQRASDPHLAVTQLNKSLNDSGRPDQFRVDPTSAKMIQQINPANGQVIGQFSVDEFPALAQSIGASGLLVDALA